MHQTNYVPRPCPPRVILSEAAPLTKNQAHPPTIAAQSNPAPSGAPAGGISLVERHHITPRTALCPRPRWAGCVTRSRWNNGDPACWRPAREAGFDCAALFGCRVRPYTRCAASLRMTRRGAGARDEKQNAVSVRKVKCRISLESQTAMVSVKSAKCRIS